MRYLLFLFATIALAQPPVGSRPFRLDELKTQPGYEVGVYAHVNGGPRLMIFGPNGVLYVAARGGNTVVAIPRENQTVIALRGLSGPHSVAFRGNDLYVSVDSGVLLFRDAVTDDLIVRSQSERLLSLPTGGQHTSRTLGIGPDGKLYVTAGSSCNFCSESDAHRAAMMRYDIDGTRESIHARGLRNSVSFGWHPATGQLWALDNGGDGLGDQEPPEEINIVEAGADYGWPDCVGNRRGVNWGSQARLTRCGQTVGPEWEIPAHSAPLGISFYTGDQFPASFQNDALVGLHGSWNRNDPSGYKVIRVRASSGHAVAQEDFLWGFFDAASRTRSGRPIQALTGPDGAVYISDDATGNIYRVAYKGPRINPGGIVRVSGAIYSLYGTNLASDAGNVRIFANGLAAEILYAGPSQVNFIIPGGLTGDVTIGVKNDRAADEALLRIEE